MMSQKGVNMALMVLNTFVGLTAIAGGVGLLTGGVQIPLELLRGSPFTSYTLPGLVLAIVVGGSTLVAAVMLLMRYKARILASALAGLFMVVFEVVEIAVIDRSVTIGIALQVFYSALGLLILGLAGYLWLTEDRHHHRRSGRA